MIVWKNKISITHYIYFIALDTFIDSNVRDAEIIIIKELLKIINNNTKINIGLFYSIACYG